LKTPSPACSESILRLIQEALGRGARVEIDGLGSFVPDQKGSFEFLGKSLPTVFITYAHEDSLEVEALYDALTIAGFDPWMDRRKLMPGQNWARAIEDAMGVSEFVIACFSSRSVNKKGGFQAEIRHALECAQRIPLDHVFLIPVRLDDCRVPERITREVQYVDLFPNWEAGLVKVLKMLRQSRLPKLAA
jgi:hypothetical protein